jgi:hypothetical protein
MPSGEGRASNHELHALRNNFFIANTVLHRTDRALVVKDVRDLRDRDTSMNRLGGNDAVVAPR